MPLCSQNIHVLIACSTLFSSVALAAPIARKPSIQTAPSGGSYTTWDFAHSADAQAAVQEVRSVTSNGSFISRSLIVITNSGQSKKFETITGEDGLTFGIKDFTSGGVLPLLSLIDQQDKKVIPAAFPTLAAQVLDTKWINANTSSHDNRGLVAIRDFRVGLDSILCDRRFHAAQLQRYREEAVNPSLAAFQKRGYRLQFSLAAMIGVANSFGAGSESSGTGMIGRLNAAQQAVHSKDEAAIIKEFVRAYAVRDAKDAAQRAAALKLVSIGFEEASGTIPSADSLGHSGRRIRLLFLTFPWSQQLKFDGLGDFVLAADEKL